MQHKRSCACKTCKKGKAKHSTSKRKSWAGRMWSNIAKKAT